jgi:hypothetical protein
MATPNKQPNTHITAFKGRFRIETSNPTTPLAGDIYFDPNQNYLMYYTGATWIGALFK